MGAKLQVVLGGGTRPTWAACVVDVIAVSIADIWIVRKSVLGHVGPQIEFSIIPVGAERAVELKLQWVVRGASDIGHIQELGSVVGVDESGKKQDL